AARRLGWPLLPSYGMTECCSQIATASVDSAHQEAAPDLFVLSHLEARSEDDGRLSFRGQSLLTGYALFDSAGRPQFVDPKVGGWFVSEDAGNVVLIDGKAVLQVEGRRGRFVKIGGEPIYLSRL